MRCVRPRVGGDVLPGVSHPRRAAGTPAAGWRKAGPASSSALLRQQGQRGRAGSSGGTSSMDSKGTARQGEEETGAPRGGDALPGAVPGRELAAALRPPPRAHGPNAARLAPLRLRKGLATS